VDIPRDRVQDPFEKNVPGKGFGRDPERTPMQWDPGPHAGFTTGEPWLPIAKDWKRVNVQEQRDNADSILALYRRLITLRRGEPALEVGRFEAHPATHDVLAYFRRAREGDTSFLVALNLGSRPQALAATPEMRDACVIVGTHHEREGERIDGDVVLGPHEGVVLRLA
jgi:alpha-glucosidase